MGQGETVELRTLDAGFPGSPPDGHRLKVGDRLGEFLVLDFLGAGGMGEVYLAEQTSLKRKVALKTLKRDLVDSPGFLERFRAEAETVAPISHPNIVSVIAIGHDRGFHFIAFEFVEGVNLRAWLQRNGPMPIDDFLSAFEQVARALERAAEAGIVHRDIKPDNVLLTSRKDVKVADFGLARLVGAGRPELTQSGHTLGTPLYMSPEQVEGRNVDHRSDLYSLGVMGFHMLAGRPPYEGDSPLAVALKHLRAEAPPLDELRPDCPLEIVALIARLMEKAPANRPQSATDVLAWISRCRRQSNSSNATSTLPLSAGPAEGWMTDRGPLTERLSESIDSMSTGRRRLLPAAFVMACIGASFGIGAAAAWLRLPTKPAVGSGPSLEAGIRPAMIPKQESAWTQLAYALDVLPEKDCEAGLWAVLEFFVGDVNETVAASVELMQRYLPRRQYDKAMAVADFMAERENGTQKMVGELFRGIVESRRGRASESNRAFVELFERAATQGKGKEIRLPQPELDWVARQYLLALRVNYERLGKPVNEQMIERFWTTILPPAPARGVRR